MNLDRRKVVLFGLQFIPPFVLLACVYSWIRPVYQAMVLGAANALLSRLAPLTEVRILQDGVWRVQLTRPDLEASFHIGGNEHSLVLFLSLLILPPLLLATPVRVGERLRLLTLGVVLLFVAHVVSVSACVYGMGLVNDPNSFVFRSLPKVLRLSSQGIAVSLWGLLTWRYWLPRVDAAGSQPEPSVPRGGPCPCGSGLRFKRCCGKTA